MDASSAALNLYYEPIKFIYLYFLSVLLFKN